MSGTQTSTGATTSATTPLPRTLKKGESQAWSAVASALCAVFTWLAICWFAGALIPRSQWPILFVFIKIFGAAFAAMVGIAVWHSSKLPDVLPGSKGVPTWFGGRVQWFLFPEGNNRGFPWVVSLIPVDMRTRLLIGDGATRSIHIPALARSTPTPIQSGRTSARRNSKTKQPRYFVPVTIIVSAPVKVTNAYTHLEFDDPDRTNINKVIAAMRAWVMKKEVLKLPELKDVMTKHLQSVAGTFGDMGVEAKNFEVMDVEIPDEITKAAIQISVEQTQAASEGRQAATLAANVKILKKALPGLTPEELRNMVLAASDLAKMTIQTVETKGPTATLNVVGGNKGGTP